MAKFILDLNYPIEEQLDELNERLFELGKQIRVYCFELNSTDEDED